MAKNIAVYESGTKARLVINPAIDGIITACLIRYGAIEYEFAYWNGEIVTKWVKPGELTIESGQKASIGFQTSNK